MFAHMHLLITLCILLSYIENILNYPLQNAEHIIQHKRNINDEILMSNDAAYECKYSDLCILLKENQNHNNENNDNGNNNEPLMDTTRNDDLIFLAERPIPIQQKQQQQQQQEQHQKENKGQQTGEVYHQIDLLTSADEDALVSSSSSLASASASLEHTDSGGSSNSNNAVAAALAPDEIELHIDNSTHTPRMPPVTMMATTQATATTPTPPIDMSDFVTLIPTVEVKSIAVNYYRNDAEVQRAYAYLSSQNFAILRQQIINLPEMAAFLIYLNNSGFDLIGLLYTIRNLTSMPLELATIGAAKKVKAGSSESNVGVEVVRVQGDEIVRAQLTTISATPLTSTIATKSTLKAAAAATTSTTTTTTTKQPVDESSTITITEQLNGLHGLVDSVLGILPQDQILATFFDKLETNEQFSKLVDSIGSPGFANILNNMQNSVPLRNLIFALHNNGIYIKRIVDSLKAYFFLGSF